MSHELNRETPLSTPLAVLFVVATGAALTFAATKATANVTRGKLLLRWMVVVFAAYMMLITLPILFGF